MNGSPPVPKHVEGKYVLFAIVLLGVAGGGGGWWYHQRLQSRPLSLWGSEAANLILRAPEVELCRLQKAPAGGTSTDVLLANGETYETINCKDATRMRGFLHLRHSLLNDYSFDWSDRESAACEWRYALRFRDGDQAATLLISTDFNYALLVERQAMVSIKPIADGLSEVLGGAESTGERRQ